MESKVMRLEDIKPAEYNPRVRLTEVDHEYKALKASIDEFGLVVPLKTGHSTTVRSINTSPGHIPRRCSNW